MFFNQFQIGISHDTVTRRLKEQKFSFLSPRIVQCLKPEQIRIRYNYCLNSLNNDADFFYRIIFSDESKFSSFLIIKKDGGKK